MFPTPQLVLLSLVSVLACVVTSKEIRRSLRYPSYMCKQLPSLCPDYNGRTYYYPDIKEMKDTAATRSRVEKKTVFEPYGADLCDFHPKFCRQSKSNNQEFNPDRYFGGKRETTTDTDYKEDFNKRITEQDSDKRNDKRVVCNNMCQGVRACLKRCAHGTIRYL